MLTAHQEDTEVAKAVVRFWNRLWRGFDWDHGLVAWCAAFHFLVAFTLTLAPFDQLLSRGTAPVFALASRYVWALWFALGAAAAVSLLRSHRFGLQVATWMTVFPLGGVWLTAFVMAVIDGGGNAIGVIVWPFLYGPWIVAAVRLGLGKR